MDRLRDLLDTGAVHVLQSKMAELGDGKASKENAELLRRINRELFQTTDPIRRETIAIWKENYPKSRYASAAVIWVELSEALQTGSNTIQLPSEQADVDRWGPNPTYQRVMTQANKSYLKHGGYIGLLDVWLIAYQHTPLRTKNNFKDDSQNQRVYQRLMNVAPNVDSMRLIVGAASKAKGNSVNNVVEVCSRYTRFLAGYNEEACIIDAAGTHSLDQELKIAAIQAIAEHGFPIQDATRLAFEFDHANKNRRSAEFEKVVGWHLNTIQHGMDVQEFRRQAGEIMGGYDQPDYKSRADEHLLNYLDHLLKDDPLNKMALLTKIEVLMERRKRTSREDDLTEAQATWEAAVGSYAQENRTFWWLGADIAKETAADHAAVSQIPFWNNALAYSKHSYYDVYIPLYELYIVRDAAKTKLANKGGGGRANPVGPN